MKEVEAGGQAKWCVCVCGVRPQRDDDDEGRPAAFHGEVELEAAVAGGLDGGEAQHRVQIQLHLDLRPHPAVDPHLQTSRAPSQIHPIAIIMPASKSASSLRCVIVLVVVAAMP